MDVAAWAGQVLGTSPVEDEGYFFSSGWRQRTLRHTSRVDVAAWAGQVLGTSPVEDEG